MDDAGGTTELMTLQRAREQLGVMFELVQRGQVRCSAATKKPSLATQQLLSEALPGGEALAGEHLYAFAWPLLFQAGGLASGTKLELTAKGRAALKKDPDEVLLALWDRWVRAGVIDELSRIEAIKGQRRASTLSALKNRRSQAAGVLDLLAINDFISVAVAFDDLPSIGASFSVVRNERAKFKLYLEESEYGSLGYSDIDFERIVDRRYLMVLLFEYAATLGLVDVRYTDPENGTNDFGDLWGADGLEYLSRYDGLEAVRLTRLGALACSGAVNEARLKTSHK